MGFGSLDLLLATLEPLAQKSWLEEFDLSGGFWEFVKQQAVSFARENPFVVFLALWGAVRSLGTTVQSGTQGLFFSFGRAKRVLEPGFVFKIPFLQRVSVIPTRSRTMDVPDQKVTSSDGLVWFVDVNLVYRVVDVRKALIEVDDLVHGMQQMLSLSVQEIVRASGRGSLRNAGELDPLLELAMKRRLEPWGVDIESAGFTSVRPSPKTLRFTQQFHATEERRKALAGLEARGLDHGLSLAMLGSAPQFQRRERRAIAREDRSRRRRRISQAIRRAELASQEPLGSALRKQMRRRILAQLKA